MNALKQIAAVVGMNLRAMPSRMTASLVIVIGMTIAVAVALSVFSMAAGLTNMAKESTSPDRMVLLGPGTIGAGGASNISRDILTSIADLPGIRKDADGKPLVSGEIAVTYVTRKRENGVDVSMGLRGTDPNVFALRPELKLIQGRMFTPGLREILAGKGAADRFETIDLGSQILLADGPWTIVGIVETPSALYNFGLMADANTLMASMRRGAFNQIYVRLDEGTKAAQDRFIGAIKDNPGLTVDVESEYDYRAGQMANTTRFYTFLAYWVGGIMGVGAVLAALNTMYIAVSARVTEIATLRAIGFSAAPVVVSILVESLALAVLGALIGVLIAKLGFGGRDQNYQNVAISLVVSPAMMATGMGLSLAVGFVGALFPAIRAAQLPVTTALQAK